ncbi:hypothetical protein CAP39_14985 [Sphingomonas sp. IBVSS1]|nr:hypothetical protein CAP39_14985 [Sphingomonas sp. IBVSS1]
MAIANPGAGTTQALRRQVAHDLGLADLKSALAAGWQDYRAQPQFGLGFAAVYVMVGLALTWVMAGRGDLFSLIPAAAGFPLLAPFCAVGLYEVSRRREQGLPLRWPPVLGALKGHGDQQLLAMGVVLFVAFGFWLMIAHGIFAVALAESGAKSESLAFLLTPSGAIMLLVGGGVGSIIALAFYAATVISLPMLVDRDVDFLSAIITSFAVVRANGAIMLAWAVLIAAGLFLAMLPLFLGLLVVLPVLGHATWHLYRRAVSAAAAPAAR